MILRPGTPVAGRLSLRRRGVIGETLHREIDVHIQADVLGILVSGMATNRFLSELQIAEFLSSFAKHGCSVVAAPIRRIGTDNRRETFRLDSAHASIIQQNHRAWTCFAVIWLCGDEDAKSSPVRCCV